MEPNDKEAVERCQRRVKDLHEKERHFVGLQMMSLIAEDNITMITNVTAYSIKGHKHIIISMKEYDLSCNCNRGD